MKIWFKLLVGAVLGTVLGLFAAPQNQALTEFLAWLETLAINIGRYTLVPALFFSLVLGVYRLRQDSRFWRVMLQSVIFLAAGTLALVVLAVAVTLIARPGRVPVQFEEELGVVSLGIKDNIDALFPPNSFSVLAGNGIYLLPLCLFAGFTGMGLSYERNFSKPFLTLLDSLSRVFYHVAVFFSEILTFVLIVLCAYWSFRFRDVFSGGQFNDIIVLFPVFSLACGFILMPLALYLLKPKINPWKALYALIAPALSAFFSGDINFTLPVLIRHEKESLGVRRRSGSVTLPLFSAFGRAGSAAIAAMAFIVIMTSYSSLEITAADVLFITIRAFAVSFLLAGHPGDGAFTALAVLCAGYDRSGYLILKPLAFYLVSCGAFLDIMFGAYASWAIAHMNGYAEERGVRNFI